MSKDQQPNLAALEQSAKNLNEAVKNFSAEAGKVAPHSGGITYNTSSYTTHDSITTRDGVVVSEEHWTNTTGDVPQDHIT